MLNPEVPGYCLVTALSNALELIDRTDSHPHHQNEKAPFVEKRRDCSSACSALACGQFGSGAGRRRKCRSSNQGA
jgi:hypothetical protein